MHETYDQLIYEIKPNSQHGQKPYWHLKKAHKHCTSMVAIKFYELLEYQDRHQCRVATFEAKMIIRSYQIFM